MMIAELLKEGDALCDDHAQVLPSMAIEWLKFKGYAELAKLAEESKPIVQFRRSEVELMPKGKVVFPIEHGQYALGSIIMVIDQPGRADSCQGHLEIVGDDRKYVQHPIEGMDRRMLVVLLTRALAAIQGA